MRAGDLLGERYRLVGELGRGGFGVVWEAYDQRVGRQVAVKTLRDQDGRQDQEAGTDRARFGREMAVLARLTHPNIVLIFDQGEAAEGGESYRYLVMELLNGLTLKQVLATERPELPRALDWARQLCAALAAAHAADVIHRDIKPENIMFTDPDHRLLKVLDFGIAQIGDNKDGGLTTAGVVIGSAPYLAPERWRGEAGTVRSDLYALGCVLFELFTGARPFTAAGTYALMVQHVEAPPVPATALPRELDRLLLDLLAKDPAARPPAAAEVGRRLERVAEAVRDLRRRADAAFQAAGEGRAPEALTQLRPLIAQFALAFGRGDGRTVRGCHDFAVLLARAGAHDQSYCLLDELLPHAAAALGEGHPDVEDIQRRLARTPVPERPCPPGVLDALLSGVNRAGS
ncbi:serine/threonine protein kinase [Kitasatospora sp. NBC_01287]|uniref:serine/threonine-protein kinase n=1 Tax=Kitasatospora sp. NBC_01287 TaxID=2903573 RepID=UPI00224C9A6B|nr:serine/threonine-protein kinase [Kitasatospora sp. NBC_01287]MCX4746764.1 serine/threonine protein kinase [Kitasatospora sp. NBC_01287]